MRIPRRIRRSLEARRKRIIEKEREDFVVGEVGFGFVECWEGNEWLIEDFMFEEGERERPSEMVKVLLIKTKVLPMKL
jgi:hypothetical protein